MNEIRARVISQEKGIYRISDGFTEKLAAVSGKFRFETDSVSDFPAVGDYVIAKWPEGDGNAVIEALFPRKSCFKRKAAGSGKRAQVVAANIDTVFICMALNGNYNIRRLERYLSVTADSGADPVVILTKADLCADVEEKKAEVKNAAPRVDVIAVSSQSGDYAGVLGYILPGKTVAFLGSSGVGKSTLINRLVGREVAATAETGDNDKGRHTTTRRELIALENGAFLIDTPGMRELGMWDNDSGIDKAFADIEELAASCRFSDCRHVSEPGCAVRAALEDGTLDASRWESYLKLKAENADIDAASRLEAKRAKFKEIAKRNKDIAKSRRR